MAPDCYKIFFSLPGGDKVEISQLSQKVSACSLSGHRSENVAAVQGVALSVTTRARALPVAIQGSGPPHSRHGGIYFRRTDFSVFSYVSVWLFKYKNNDIKN